MELKAKENYKPVVVMISGRMGSGKTTIATALEYALIEQGYITRTVKFADPLYEMQRALYSIVGKPLKGAKDRELLQWLGSEWAKPRFGETVWADVFLKTVKNMAVNVSFVINDDMRFPVEFDAATELGAVTVRLECPMEVRRGRIGPEVFKNIEHPSETALDGELNRFDLVINTSDFNVQDSVKQILAAIEERMRERLLAG